MKLDHNFRMVAVTVTPFDAEENVLLDEVKKQTESLLSRCSPFVADDGEKPILSNQPAYTLDSVEDIIKAALKAMM